MTGLRVQQNQLCERPSRQSELDCLEASPVILVMGCNKPYSLFSCLLEHLDSVTLALRIGAITV